MRTELDDAIQQLFLHAGLPREGTVDDLSQVLWNAKESTFISIDSVKLWIHVRHVIELLQTIRDQTQPEYPLSEFVPHSQLERLIYSMAEVIRSTLVCAVESEMAKAPREVSSTLVNAAALLSVAWSSFLVPDSEPLLDNIRLEWIARGFPVIPMWDGKRG